MCGKDIAGKEVTPARDSMASLGTDPICQAPPLVRAISKALGRVRLQSCRLAAPPAVDMASIRHLATGIMRNGAAERNRGAKHLREAAASMPSARHGSKRGGKRADAWIVMPAILPTRSRNTRSSPNESRDSRLNTWVRP